MQVAVDVKKIIASEKKDGSIFARFNFSAERFTEYL